MRPTYVPSDLILFSSLTLAMSLAVSAAYAADDAVFIQKAANASLFEVQSSQQALQKSNDAEIKTFAQQMITDHTQASNNLKTAVRQAKLDTAIIPTAVDSDHADKLKKLASLSGEAFDDEYTDLQAKGHEDAVALFRDYAQDGNTPALRTFAVQTLPTLKQHEEHADALDGKH